jgi:hypothetical protein
MAKFKKGDRVITTAAVPMLYTIQTGIGPGEIGVVDSVCDCAGVKFQQGATCVEFDNTTTCLFDAWLEKLPDVPKEDKMVDWSQVPKPWEIGVKGH